MTSGGRGLQSYSGLRSLKDGVEEAQAQDWNSDWKSRWGEESVRSGQSRRLRKGCGTSDTKPSKSPFRSKFKGAIQSRSLQTGCRTTDTTSAYSTFRFKCKCGKRPRRSARLCGFSQRGSRGTHGFGWSYSFGVFSMAGQIGTSGARTGGGARASLRAGEGEAGGAGEDTGRARRLAGLVRDRRRAMQLERAARRPDLQSRRIRRTNRNGTFDGVEEKPCLQRLHSMFVTMCTGRLAK